jgi:hypothetical protein
MPSTHLSAMEYRVSFRRAMTASIRIRRIRSGSWRGARGGVALRPNCPLAANPIVATIAKDRREGDWVGSGDSACVDGKGEY